MKRRNLVKIREVLGHEVHTHECVKSIGYTLVLCECKIRALKLCLLRHELWIKKFTKIQSWLLKDILSRGGYKYFIDILRDNQYWSIEFALNEEWAVMSQAWLTTLTARYD